MSATLPEPASSSKPATSDDGFVIVHLDDSGAASFPFLLQRSGSRMSRSVAVSVGLHVVGIAAFFLLSLILPAFSTGKVEEPTPSKLERMVFLAQIGPGGGGGGGGNQNPEPARKLELPGK